MERKTLIGFWLWFMAITLCSAALLTQGVVKAQASDCDPLAPVISITSPAAGGGSYQTDQPFVDLAGQASDDIGVTKVTWSNDRGGSGTAQGTTSWAGPCYWEAKAIPLSEGDNLITVTALDTAANSKKATLTVTYNTPLPPPKVLLNRQAKFTFYFGGTGYNNIDRFSVVANLLKGASEVFVMPFNKDVTVTVRVPDPRDQSKQIQLFTQTIPAGKATGSTAYRYLSSYAGIRELYLARNTPTTIYLYLFVDKVNFLPGIKPTMSTAEYKNFVRGIKSYNLTLKIGDTTYSGDAPLSYGTDSDHKQELVYNR
jgi:hypothetical protein